MTTDFGSGVCLCRAKDVAKEKLRNNNKFLIDGKKDGVNKVYAI